MMVGVVRGVLATVAIGWCSATAASAAVDMNGAWFLRANVPLFEYQFACHLSVTQTGTSLTIQGDGCPYIGNFTGAGTIDVGTGAFSASSTWAFCTHGVSVTGNTNSTSTEFAGTFSCQTANDTFLGTLNGSRCGNRVLDAGETCDDGNQSPLDCCSPTCTLDASGATCSTDDDPCTSGTCDGAGTCENAPAEGAPCDDDDNPCTDDVCDASGACQHVPNAASCDDGDACTLNDVCSGGSCTAGTCSPCCDPLAGCVPAPASGCKQSVSPNGLLTYLSVAGRPKTLQWDWRNGEATTPAELGDPTTSTSYAVCLYRRTGASEELGLVLAAEAPAGATSGTRPSWKVRKKGGAIKFKHTGGNADGLTSIYVRPGGAGRPKLRVLGKGALDFNPVNGPRPVIAQLRASNGTCFEASFSRRIRDTVFVAGEPFEPPFSLDFMSKDAP